MKKNLLFILLLFSFSTLFSQTFTWAKQYGMQGNTSDNAYFVALDNPGNVYIAGNYKFTTDFDPGPGTYTLTSTNNSEDTYLMKTDPSGNFIWARGFGGTMVDAPAGMAVDKTSGDVVVVGSFKGILDFDPGPANLSYTATNSDGYIIKLNAAGNFAWSHNLSGTNSQYVNDVTIDATGNIYVVGGFGASTVDFDPGPGTYTMNGGTGGSTFILKLSSSGSFIWAKQSMVAGPRSITIDATGSLIISGGFSNTCDFDPGPAVYNLTDFGGGDIYAMKIDAAGNFVWAKQIGGPGAESVSYITSDATGDITLTGHFSTSNVDFDPGPSTYTLSTSGSDDGYVLKLNTNGNFVWARSFGGTGVDRIHDVSTDPSGNVYTTGYFSNTVDFDTGPSVFNLTVVGQLDCFIHKLDAAGNFMWAYQVGGISNEMAYGIAASANEAYVVGVFHSNVDFDPSTTTYTMSAFTDQDCFIMKLGGSVSINEPGLQTKSSMFPNPVINKLNLVSLNPIQSISITDVSGKTILLFENINSTEFEINTSSLTEGVYFATIKGDQTTEVRKFIKQ